MATLHEQLVEQFDIYLAESARFEKDRRKEIQEQKDTE